MPNYIDDDFERDEDESDESDNDESVDAAH